MIPSELDFNKCSIDQSFYFNTLTTVGDNTEVGFFMQDLEGFHIAVSK